MKENTNKAIAFNSIVLYVRMIMTTICMLFMTRFALQALGVVDYGLYSVLGGIVAFIGVFNSIMTSTANRFIAVAIGKGDDIETNKIFNVVFTSFCTLALCLLIIALPIGYWYILRFVNYDGDIINAIIVFSISVLGSMVSSTGTSFNGLLMAKEKFLFFSVIDILVHVVKMMIAYILISHFEHKLIIYACTFSLCTASTAFAYFIYCKRHYASIIKWNFVRDKAYYKNVFSFSGWVAYGAFACMAKAQGAALLVNAFFNTIMNTALGLANTVNSFVTLFAQNATQPMAPQITKSYAAGNHERTDELLVMSTKLSFLLMFLVSSPFYVQCDWIMLLWLGQVPAYAVSFTMLLVTDNLVNSFNMGISNVLFASGKIKLYQVLINTLRLASILIAFIALKCGFPPQSLFISYIFVSLLVVIATQWVLHRELNYNNSILFKRSYIPSLFVVACCLPIFFINLNVHPIFDIVVTTIYIIGVEFLVGLSKKERNMIIQFVKTHIK